MHRLITSQPSCCQSAAQQCSADSSMAPTQCLQLTAAHISCRLGARLCCSQHDCQRRTGSQSHSHGAAMQMASTMHAEQLGRHIQQQHGAQAQALHCASRSPCHCLQSIRQKAHASSCAAMPCNSNPPLPPPPQRVDTPYRHDAHHCR
jgi:hypothetical protein